MDKQPDWPPQTLVTGFPWYDRHGEGRLPAELAQFLDAGAPPLVFTLGTAIAEDAGAAGFFAASAVAAKLLGRRAVLILNEPRNRGDLGSHGGRWAGGSRPAHFSFVKAGNASPCGS